MAIEQVDFEAGGYRRTVWFSAGPDRTNHPLCVFLDGDHYLESVGAEAILRESIAAGRIPQMSFAFVAHHSAAARHEDYTCNDRFAGFVARHLLAWAVGRVPSIASEGNIVCGLSLSGLASAHIALTFPQVFSRSLCQSGSFWWRQQRFATLAREHAPTSGSRYWLSVGDEETEEDVSHPPTAMVQGVSQITGVVSAVEGLRAGGAEVEYHLLRGGHAFGPWADELGDALRWLSRAGSAAS